MADRFNLSYPDPQVRFGLMSREEVWNYVESAPLSVATIADPPLTGGRSTGQGFAISRHDPTLPLCRRRIC